MGLWEVLDLAQLKEFTETFDKGLGMSTTQTFVNTSLNLNKS